MPSVPPPQSATSQAVAGLSDSVGAEPGPAPLAADAGRDAPLIEAVHLSRRLERPDVDLLDDVSLAIRSGERIGLAGPSGSGKTLLLRALALLDPVDEGEVRWQGRRVEHHAVPCYRRDVIYLHQKPVLWDASVEFNLRQPLALAVRRDQTFRREWIAGQLAQLGRPATFLDKPARELSGGEAQIVAVLRAIQLEPRVLLLDEPTASLDPAAATAIERLIMSWFSERSQHRAFVWVSHDSSQLIRTTDRLLFMEGGRLRS